MTPHKYVTGQEEFKQQQQQQTPEADKFKDISNKVKRGRGKRSQSRETM
ncbi:MAG: hypothetical protein NZ730_11130 [Porticoccaceae bacterium]|nr:hypothetical protein [Porticoccaceae bacterium]